MTGKCINRDLEELVLIGDIYVTEMGHFYMIIEGERTLLFRDLSDLINAKPELINILQRHIDKIKEITIQCPSCKKEFDIPKTDDDVIDLICPYCKCGWGQVEGKKEDEIKKENESP